MICIPVSNLLKQTITLTCGNSLSGTSHPEAYEYTDTTNGSRIILIDTPGWDDLNKTHLAILTTLVQYLESRKDFIITSVIFLHRITDDRVTGSSKLILSLLKAFCGKHFAKNMMLVTTMWNKVPKELLSEAEDREVELNYTDVFWGSLIEKGAGYARWNGTSASSKAIIEKCRDQPQGPLLQMIEEARKGTPVEETKAGKVLTEETRRLEALEEQRIREEQEQFARLEEQRRELQHTVRNMQPVTTYNYASSQPQNPQTGYRDRDRMPPCSQPAYDRQRPRHERYVGEDEFGNPRNLERCADCESSGSESCSTCGSTRGSRRERSSKRCRREDGKSSRGSDLWGFLRR